MRWIFADSETFYSNEYTLRKQDPAAYILDPRFEHICLGVAEAEGQPYLVDGPDIPKWCADIGDPSDIAFVTHNALFDACIMSWHYDWVPKLYCCTLSMARALLSPWLRSKSLASVARHFGWAKGDFIQDVKGMGRADIVANGMWAGYTSYCLNDVALCRAAFWQMQAKLPAEEYVLQDMVLRMAIEPSLRVNLDKLAENLAEVRASKELIFAQAMLVGINNIQDLTSDQRLADVLIGLGVDPPMKISPATGKPTFAFARSDVDFMELLDHENDAVRIVVQARLDHKTTLEETRSERMLNIARLEFPSLGSSGWMPIPLKFSGAHTHRLSGDWRLNAQNWGRQSKIREAIVTPQGYSLVVADSKQIEARMNATFSGQWDLVQQFENGEDVYANFAVDVFHVPVSKQSDPGKRFVGKTGILQLGYQSAWLKFQTTVKILSRKEGTPIDLTDSEAFNTVSTYREKMWAIRDMWSTLGQVIHFMATARPGAEYVIGPITFRFQHFEGPGGLRMTYNNLRYNENQWWYDYEERPHKIYGGKLLENIIQFLARIVVMGAAVRLKKPMEALGAWLCMTSHDELCYLVPDENVTAAKQLLREEMTRRPDWMPRLPLDVDIGVGKTYADAK